MKIAITGKGGVGKTTLTAILARTLARSGLTVVAVDADPNPNMAIALRLGVDEGGGGQRPHVGVAEGRRRGGHRHRGLPEVT